MPSTAFVTCTAAALGLAPADAYRVIPRGFANTRASACGSPGADSLCCCDVATLVQFDVSAADEVQAGLLAATMPEALIGTGMIQCLKVGNHLLRAVLLARVCVSPRGCFITAPAWHPIAKLLLSQGGMLCSSSFLYTL